MYTDLIHCFGTCLGAAAIVILGHAALLEPGLENEFGADSQV